MEDTEREEDDDEEKDDKEEQKWSELAAVSALRVDLPGRFSRDSFQHFQFLMVTFRFIFAFFFL